MTLIRRGTVAALAVAAFTCTPAAVAFGAPAVSGQAAVRDDASSDRQQPMPTSPVSYEIGESLAKLRGRQLEVTFLGEIIPHHQAAIDMAELELERGTDPDVRTHAENIIASQRQQIEQFTRWLREWYGLTPEEAMEQAPAEVKREMADMEKESGRMMKELREVGKGKQFDIEFVRRMIPHHSGAVIEFLEPQARADHAQLRVAAVSGVVNQESEIADFRTWLSGRTMDADPQGSMPKGAADTGDGGSQTSATPLVAGGAAVAAAGGGIGLLALRRRHGAEGA